jgi:poly(beta-D-mannuronate) lyase
MRSLPAALLLTVTLLSTTTAPAATTEVKSLDDLKAALDKANPGDRIVLADGAYDSRSPITINRAGTQDNPIVVEARTVGGVEIKGDAGFQMAAPAAYVVVKGFVFTHRAGAVRLPAGVHHCRFTRNVFALKVAPDGRSTYMTIDGDDNEIDHNTFRDKDTEGQMLFVQGPGTTQAKRTWIHHNYFLDFRKSGKNNASGLHVGSSHRSMDSGFSVVEYNLFVRNVGENEGAICNKSCDNIYRFNTIVDSTELSLRHGHRCRVYGNFILNSEGLRFFGWDHEIFANYFSGNKPAIAIGNGDGLIPPGPLTVHQKPERVKVVYNTLVDNKANVQMGARAKNALGADDLVFADNVIRGGNKAVSIAGPAKDAKFEGNVVWGTDGGAGDLPAGAFTEADPGLVKDDHGIWRARPGTALAGKGAGTYPFASVDLDGRARPAGTWDVGAEQVSAGSTTNRGPLTEGDVGPGAKADGDRALIAAPKADFIPKR